MPIGAETVAVMSPGFVTVAVTTGVKQCQLEQKLLL